MEKTINCDAWKKREKFSVFFHGLNMRKITDNLREKARENIEENPELFLVKIRVDFRVSCDDEIPSPLAFGLFDGI